MRSPIHLAEDDLDAVLMYAPPRVRNQAEPVLPPTPQLPALLPGRSTQSARSRFSGDRAMMQLQRELALNPDKVPEPPTHGARSLMPVALRVCALGGVAALVAWAFASVPGTRHAAAPTAPASYTPPPGVLRAKDTSVADARPRVLDRRADTSEPPLQAAPAPVPPAPSPAPLAAQTQTKQADAS